MRCTEQTAQLPAATNAALGVTAATAARPAGSSRRALLQGVGPWLLTGAPAWALLAGCAQRPSPAPETPPVPALPPVPPLPPPAPVPAPSGPAAAPGLPLGAPAVARSWAEFQVLAARRLVAANPGRVYIGAVPDPLLAIPVLEVELHADGSVRAIKVLRQPTQARDTVQLAIDAVRRAAPYGSVARLPRPWRFVEVFLFDDERRFKPRTLDL